MEFLKVRPWPIHAFALMFGGVGLWGLVIGLQSLDNWEYELMLASSVIAWNRDWVIVFLSARFTIVMIPVVAIFLFASRIARLLITIMAAISLIGAARAIMDAFEYDVIDWEPLVLLSITYAAVILLYVPAARDWFAVEEAMDQKVFE